MAKVFATPEDKAEWELAKHALKEVRFNLDTALHRRLRVLAAERDMSLADLTRRLLTNWADKQEQGRG